MPKVFVSYSHKQGNWVWNTLIPCLKAGGVEVLIDRERFEAGEAIVGQMDALQYKARKHLLVLSEAYLQSEYCMHEMKRALKLDPKFENGLVIVVRVDDCDVPAKLSKALYLDLRNQNSDEHKIEQWEVLFRSLPAPEWMKKIDEIARYVDDRYSVSITVNSAVPSVVWKSLFLHLKREKIHDLAVVDLQSGLTASRHGLIEAIVKELGIKISVPKEPDDLPTFEGAVLARDRSIVALTHFDLANHRYRPYYDVDLYGCLRSLMEKRKLIMLFESHSPFSELIPRDNPLSAIDLKTVEIK
ncbi:MAG: toll/interleukin-1 receptor domain-containing protein [Candidatus Omnitrophota bacterium]|jgi:hypothetical protein|nr:MAG: toll/interleukin-1 receptor domain-containing protein [Candidatus Omnitrophota bacterium]